PLSRDGAVFGAMQIELMQQFSRFQPQQPQRRGRQQRRPEHFLGRPQAGALGPQSCLRGGVRAAQQGEPIRIGLRVLRRQQRRGFDQDLYAADAEQADGVFERVRLAVVARQRAIGLAKQQQYQRRIAQQRRHQGRRTGTIGQQFQHGRAGGRIERRLLRFEQLQPGRQRARWGCRGGRFGRLSHVYSGLGLRQVRSIPREDRRRGGKAGSKNSRDSLGLTDDRPEAVEARRA